MKANKIIAELLLFAFSMPVLASAENKLEFGSTKQQASGVLEGKKKRYKVPLDASVYQTLFNLPSYTCGELGVYYGCGPVRLL